MADYQQDSSQPTHPLRLPPKTTRDMITTRSTTRLLARAQTEIQLRPEGDNAKFQAIKRALSDQNVLETSESNSITEKPHKKRRTQVVPKISLERERDRRRRRIAQQIQELSQQLIGRLSSKDWAEADKILVAITSLMPSGQMTWELCHARGCVAAETGDREGAIQLYLKGLGLNPCASPIITSLQKMGYNGPGLAAGSVSIQTTSSTQSQDVDMSDSHIESGFNSHLALQPKLSSQSQDVNTVSHTLNSEVDLELAAPNASLPVRVKHTKNPFSLSDRPNGSLPNGSNPLLTSSTAQEAPSMLGQSVLGQSVQDQPGKIPSAVVEMTRLDKFAFRHERSQETHIVRSIPSTTPSDLSLFNPAPSGSSAPSLTVEPSNKPQTDICAVLQSGAEPQPAPSTLSQISAPPLLPKSAKQTLPPSPPSKPSPTTLSSQQQNLGISSHSPLGRRPLPPTLPKPASITLSSQQQSIDSTPSHRSSPPPPPPPPSNPQAPKAPSSPHNSSPALQRSIEPQPPLPKAPTPSSSRSDQLPEERDPNSELRFILGTENAAFMKNISSTMGYYTKVIDEGLQQQSENILANSSKIGALTERMQAFTQPSKNPNNTSNATPPARGKRTKKNKRIVLEDEYKDEPERVNFLKVVSKHMHRCMGIDKLSEIAKVKPSPSKKEIEDFEKGKPGCINVSKENFRFDLDRSRDSAFNQKALRVVARDLLARIQKDKWYPTPRIPEKYLNQQYVESLMYNHLKYIKNLYQRHLKGETEEDKNICLANGARSSRKARLYSQRYQTLVANTQLSSHMDILETVNSQGVSSDESDPDDTDHHKAYRRISPAWRHQDLQRFMWRIDEIWQNNKTPKIGHRSIKGHEFRKRNFGSSKNEDAPAPPGLPINCYAPDWLKNLNEEQMRELDIKGAYDFGLGGSPSKVISTVSAPATAGQASNVLTPTTITSATSTVSAVQIPPVVSNSQRYPPNARSTRAIPAHPKPQTKSSPSQKARGKATRSRASLSSHEDFTAEMEEVDVDEDEDVTEDIR